MFQRLREKMFPPPPVAVFTDPTLGALSWDPRREVWCAELGPAAARQRFEFMREKPSPVPPEPLLAHARELSGRFDMILRSARSLLEERAQTASPERAALIRGLVYERFHLQMDRGAICAHLHLVGQGPGTGLYIILSKGMPMWLAESES